MNKWRVFHQLQKLPTFIREAHYKGWRGIEYRKEESGMGVENCGCTYEWKRPAGWYGYPPGTSLNIMGMNIFTSKKRIEE